MTAPVSPPRRHLPGGEEKSAHRVVAAQADGAGSCPCRGLAVASGTREVRERGPVRLVRLDVARGDRAECRQARRRAFGIADRAGAEAFYRDLRLPNAVSN